MSGFIWEARDGGFYCKAADNVTLVVTPERYANGKPARGAKWHAQASIWCERTRCMSRFGRDEYLNLQDTARAAQSLAEDIYCAATKRL